MNISRIDNQNYLQLQQNNNVNFKKRFLSQKVKNLRTDHLSSLIGGIKQNEQIAKSGWTKLIKSGEKDVLVINHKPIVKFVGDKKIKTIINEEIKNETGLKALYQTDKVKSNDVKIVSEVYSKKDELLGTRTEEFKINYLEPTDTYKIYNHSITKKAQNHSVDTYMNYGYVDLGNIRNYKQDSKKGYIPMQISGIPKEKTAETEIIEKLRNSGKINDLDLEIAENINWVWP